MNLFTKPCPVCGENYFSPRLGGKARGTWMGFDKCPSCRKKDEANDH
jgi:endogenous inhibitor of DNA gyrase (YacG/DUF329 family)